MFGYWWASPRAILFHDLFAQRHIMRFEQIIYLLSLLILYHMFSVYFRLEAFYNLLPWQTLASLPETVMLPQNTTDNISSPSMNQSSNTSAIEEYANLYFLHHSDSTSIVLVSTLLIEMNYTFGSQ